MKRERSRTRYRTTDAGKDVSFAGAEEAAKNDLENLQQEELSGPVSEEDDLTQTETDENADEGLGDGKLGKSVDR